MNKQWFLTIVLVVLSAIYVVFFTDLNKKEFIQISWREMPLRGRNPRPQLLFNLDKPYCIQSLKVVSVADAATNKYPHALWHLVAKKKTQPLMQIIYSHAIQGMESDIPNARPEPLEPGVEYRLLLEDEKHIKGQKDFHLR